MVSPSSNSYTSINPSIRVYELDKTTHELLDYEQYYLDLEAADMDGKWDKHLSLTMHSWYPPVNSFLDTRNGQAIARPRVFKVCSDLRY